MWMTIEQRDEDTGHWRESKICRVPPEKIPERAVMRRFLWWTWKKTVVDWDAYHDLLRQVAVGDARAMRNPEQDIRIVSWDSDSMENILYGVIWLNGRWC